MSKQSDDLRSLKNTFEAMGWLGVYAFQNYATPYLEAIAEIHGLNLNDYVSNFINDEDGPVLRVIMYHQMLKEDEELMPKSSDGEELPLAIKEHSDKGAFTADLFTTGGGLQYESQDGWEDAQDGCVAIFPAAGKQHLEEMLLPPTNHRVVYTPSWKPLNKPNGRVPVVVRAALPLFIDSVAS